MTASLHALPTETQSRRSENEVLAAAIELQSQLDQSESIDEATDYLTVRLAEILRAPDVFVMWRDDAKSPMRACVRESSDATVDPTPWLMAAGEEIAILDELIQWTRSAQPNHSDASSRRGGMMAITQLADRIGADSLVATPLVDSNETIRGVLLITDPVSELVVPFLSAFSPLLTSKLVAIERWQPGRFESAWRSIHQSLIESSNWKTAAMLVVGACVLLAAPATYTISVPIEIQPVQRRYVAAPFDGPLDRCLVRPGDLVKTGDVLAAIDARELEYELSGIRSQLQQSDQQRRGRMAEHDFGASQLAELETQRLRSQADLLMNRRENLEIRSPVDGMVVSGDWRRHEGMPLSRGENLFEIAPLDQMTVELCVPESEIAHVRTGMPVKFRTLADPDRNHIGEIVRVRPKAELREHHNVFVAEVRIANPDRLFQPGMRGHATIYSDRHSIGWNWFHRPWQALKSL